MSKARRRISPTDIALGSKVRQRRLLRSMSQEELGKAIGLTFQQVQKYENGKNRITVSRLVDIAQALKTPLEFFYTGLGGYLGAARAKGFSDGAQVPFEGDPLMRKDVAELVSAYLKIEDSRLKKSLLETAKAMAASLPKK